MRSAVIVNAVALKKKENGWKTLLHVVQGCIFKILLKQLLLVK